MATTTNYRRTEHKREPLKGDRGGTRDVTTTTTQRNGRMQRRTTERRREPGETPGTHTDSSSTTIEAEAPEGPRQHRVRKAHAAGKKAHAAGKKATGVVTGRASGSSKHVLTAAFLVGILFVAIRVLADFELNSDGTAKSKVGHPAGQYGPIPILGGLIASFFILSLLASGGGAKAKFAAIFGWAMVLTLGMFSLDEFNKTAATFKDFGKATAPPGDWTSSGSTAGNLLGTTAPVSSDATPGDTASGSTGGSGSGTNPITGQSNSLSAEQQAQADIQEMLSGLNPVKSGESVVHGWETIVDKIKDLF